MTVIGRITEPDPEEWQSLTIEQLASGTLAPPMDVDEQAMARRLLSHVRPWSDQPMCDRWYGPIDASGDPLPGWAARLGRLTLHMDEGQVLTVLVHPDEAEAKAHMEAGAAELEAPASDLPVEDDQEVMISIPGDSAAHTATGSPSVIAAKLVNGEEVVCEGQNPFTEYVLRLLPGGVALTYPEATGG